MSIVEKMTQPPHREVVIQDCVAMIDDEVKGKGGFSGIAIKTAYSMVKAVKPGFVKEVVDLLLDEWAQKLAPFYDDWQKAGARGGFGDALAGRGAEASERLLEVTDKRAEKSKNGAVRGMYQKMRGSAREHVEKALPRLGALVEKAGKA